MWKRQSHTLQQSVDKRKVGIRRNGELRVSFNNTKKEENNSKNELTSSKWQTYNDDSTQHKLMEEHFHGKLDGGQARYQLSNLQDNDAFKRTHENPATNSAAYQYSRNSCGNSLNCNNEPAEYYKNFSGVNGVNLHDNVVNFGHEMYSVDSFNTRFKYMQKYNQRVNNNNSYHKSERISRGKYNEFGIEKSSMNNSEAFTENPSYFNEIMGPYDVRTGFVNTRSNCYTRGSFIPYERYSHVYNGNFMPNGNNIHYGNGERTITDTGREWDYRGRMAFDRGGFIRGKADFNTGSTNYGKNRANTNNLQGYNGTRENFAGTCEYFRGGGGQHLSTGYRGRGNNRQNTRYNKWSHSKQFKASRSALDEVLFRMTIFSQCILNIAANFSIFKFQFCAINMHTIDR